MTSEKMAVLVVTGVIAVLLALTLARSRPEADDPGTADEGSIADHADAAEPARPRHRFVRVAGDLGVPASGERLTRSRRGKASKTPRRKEDARSYVIRRGDTFERIARRLFGSARHATALARANPGLDPKRLRVGERIVVPDLSRSRPSRRAAAAKKGAWHVVRPGERLATIARRRYGREDAWRRIYEANRGRLKSPDRLAVGMRLLLP